MQQNAINWFEIPVTDMTRARKFYSAILGVEITPMADAPTPYAFFPVEMTQSSVGGALSQDGGQKPSQDGTVVYLNCDPDLAVVERRVEAAGGKVLLPKMSIGENGFMAFILDTEGNKVGLHSMK